MTGILRALLLAALVFSSIPAVAVAQKPSVDSLLRRIEFLESMTTGLLRRIEFLEGTTTTDLERRVRDLEALSQSEPSRVQRVPESETWRDLQNWRRLRRGMKMDQVRALLGEPERVDAAGVAFTFWRWSSGHVQFDGSGKVEGWSEP